MNNQTQSNIIKEEPDESNDDSNFIDNNELIDQNLSSLDDKNTNTYVGTENTFEPYNEDSEFKIKILGLNKQGTDFLRDSDMKECFKVQKLAEKLIVSKLKNNSDKKNPNCFKLLAVTLNNTACYYKKNNRFHIALRYLARVLQIEKHVNIKDDEAVSLGSTYLNIGTILSEMKKYSESLKFLRQANDIFLEQKFEACRIFKSTKFGYFQGVYSLQ